MRWRYRTLQVPQKGTGAFVPVPAQSYSAAFNGQNLIDGNPGTVAIPSPRPPTLNDGELGGPFNQPSSVSPDVFYPSIYTVRCNRTMRFPGIGGGLTRHNDHPVPVPAGNLGLFKQNFMHRVRVGGRTVTKAVRPFTQWPTYKGSG